MGVDKFGELKFPQGQAKRLHDEGEKSRTEARGADRLTKQLAEVGRQLMTLPKVDGSKPELTAKQVATAINPAAEASQGAKPSSTTAQEGARQAASQFTKPGEATRALHDLSSSRATTETSRESKTATTTAVAPQAKVADEHLSTLTRQPSHQSQQFQHQASPTAQAAVTMSKLVRGEKASDTAKAHQHVGSNTLPTPESLARTTALPPTAGPPAPVGDRATRTDTHREEGGRRGSEIKEKDGKRAKTSASSSHVAAGRARDESDGGINAGVSADAGGNEASLPEHDPSFTAFNESADGELDIAALKSKSQVFDRYVIKQKLHDRIAQLAKLEEEVDRKLNDVVREGISERIIGSDPELVDALKLVSLYITNSYGGTFA